MRRIRSRGIVGSGFGTAFGEQFADKVQSGKIRAHELL